MKFNLGNMFNKARICVEDHKAEILLGTSIASGIGCVVTACKATGKGKEAIEAHKKSMAIKDEKMELLKNDETATFADKAGYLFWVYTQEIKRFAILYGIPIALGALSITCQLLSYGVMKKRTIGLTAVNAGLAATIEGYRQRVTKEVGKEKEKDLYYGLEDKEVHQKLTSEDGKTKDVTKTVKTSTSQAPCYTFVFNKNTSDMSTGDITYDSDILGTVQKQLNDMLKIKGRLFLNDALDLLQMKRVDYGQDVGWLYDPEHNDRGDNRVEILILETVKESVHGSLTSTIKIHFNCDGNIRNDIYNWQDYDTTGLVDGVTL